MKKLIFLIFLIFGLSSTYSQSVTGSEVSQLLYKEAKTTDASAGSNATVTSNAFYGTIEVTTATISSDGVFTLTVNNDNCKGASSVVVVSLEIDGVDFNIFSASCIVHDKVAGKFQVTIMPAKSQTLSEQSFKINYILR